MKRLRFFILFLLPLSVFGQISPTVLPFIKPITRAVINYQIAHPFCDEFQAVYDAFTTKPSATYAAYWNTIVKALVDGGAWSDLDVFYFYAIHTNDDGEALLNWTNPGTYNATAYNSPTFTAYEGFTGDGASAYIDCNWNPSANGVNYTQNSASSGIYIRTNLKSGNAFGCWNGLYYIFLTPRYSDDIAYWRINDGFNDSKANTDSRGFWVLYRTASNARGLYKNGASVDSDSQASTGIPDINMFVLARNNNGSPSNLSNFQVSCFFAGAGLTPAKITVLTNAIETCMDSMGKGIIAYNDPLGDLLMIQYLALQQRIKQHEKVYINPTP